MDTEAIPTLIFDEIDAGVGGGVAEIVGKRLQKLSGQRQVLCVTHLAQVAACANHQIKVVKENRESGAEINTSALATGDRVAIEPRVAARLIDLDELLGPKRATEACA